LEKSAIILTFDSLSKFVEEKGLLKLDNKPLLNHVVNAVNKIADEIIIVTSPKERANLNAIMISPKVQFVVEADESKEPLASALKGFKIAKGKYSLILPFGSPFVSKDIISLLFECCIGKSAVIPRWPDRQIEPLHAVYNTQQALEAAKEALANNEFDMEAMVSKMRGVRYISTLVIEQIDPDFRTFFTINTPLDLKKAIIMIKPRKSKNRT
jgi:molybdopterin-guanine dinucleotide biosynthesis protein A